MSELSMNIDDESLIILGSSPGTSLDIKCNGIMNGVLDKAQIEDALKDLTMEASASYRAHFNLADAPSTASMMAASTIITEDKTTQELQKRFGELLDENVILKDTLQQNNDSLKEQFLLIASCQDDMLKTTLQHREKFEETKALIEKLRQENKKLKQDISLLAESPLSIVNGETGEVKSEPVTTLKADPAPAKSDPGHPRSGPASAFEFVTSPEDDTVDKLTTQLELVEKQRRQVITDNEKLTWQKESLEHIVDATTKERDDLKEKLKQVELSTKITEHETELRELNFTVADLQKELEVVSVSPEELLKRDTTIKQLDDKSLQLLAELKNAKLEILKSENLKMEFADYRVSTQEIAKIQKENLQEMASRLKRATTTLFQPVRLSVGSDTNTSENAGLASNVKVYDRALKHLADLLNKLTHGLSDSLVETLGVILSLYDYRLDKSTEAQFKEGLATVKQQLERQQCDALTNIGQVRGTLTIFEGIFKDYKEVLAKSPQENSSAHIPALAAALLARGEELKQKDVELHQLRSGKDDAELMRAQLDLYRSDFEAERSARAQMASEKDSLHTDLRKAQRRCEELTQQLEEVRRLNPTVHRNATSKAGQAAPAPAPPAPAKLTAQKAQTYRCPKCLTFQTDQYSVLEDHLDYCLDDF